MLLLIFITILILIGGSILYFSFWYGITPTPSSPKAVKSILKMIPENVEGDILELGSGWGTLASALAYKFPNKHVYGYEISPIPWIFSWILKWLFSINNLTLYRKDFFKEHWREASIIICYLYPGAMLKLKSTFTQKAKPGTLVISHAFAIPGWIPLSVLHINDLYQTPVYLYKVKEADLKS